MTDAPATCAVFVTRTGWANPVKCGAPAVTQVGPTAYCADHPRQTVPAMRWW